MLHKKGIELSVNFLIIIILSIVMFGMGITIFYKIINVSDKIRTDLDQQTIDRLNRAMDDGSLIYIPDITKSAARGEYAYFGLGIRNELGDTYDFTVQVSPNPSSTHFDVVYNSGPYQLENNEKTYVLIAISPKPSASSGQQGFDVKVGCSHPTACSPDYTGKFNKIYVVVS